VKSERVTVTPGSQRNHHLPQARACREGYSSTERRQDRQPPISKTSTTAVMSSCRDARERSQFPSYHGLDLPRRSCHVSPPSSVHVTSKVSNNPQSTEEGQAKACHASGLPATSSHTSRFTVPLPDTQKRIMFGGVSSSPSSSKGVESVVI